MTKIGFHASHELFPPSKLLQWTRSRRVGLRLLLLLGSLPPMERGARAGGILMGLDGRRAAGDAHSWWMICCPGFRYHPAIVAQAAATLREMFPARFALAIGSGQALNERITGECWPPKDLRNARLQECAEVIRRLWSGGDRHSSWPRPCRGGEAVYASAGSNVARFSRFRSASRMAARRSGVRLCGDFPAQHQYESGRVHRYLCGEGLAATTISE